ncbi:MAG TPA: thiamine pyrophosphate-dependent enzyme [Burkholderiales bacterium]|jgi:sulfopyruvate decarboxylase subunit beta|nr:thiamine pyrophosphate-dependent enzyme [Burkholderiales bacterium]
MIERYDWLARLAQRVPDEALVVSTYIGAVGFEWAALTEEHPRSAMLGQMGDVIGLALGLALALPKRKVVCLDGDGSVLMELGQLVALGQEAPANLVVFVADNGVYESIGRGPDGPRPTATAGRADLAAMARACGVPHAAQVRSMAEFERELERAFAGPGCRFIDVRTAPGRARVPPRQVDGFEDKYRFVRYVEKLEGKQILRLARQDRQLME